MMMKTSTGKVMISTFMLQMGYFAGKGQARAQPQKEQGRAAVAGTARPMLMRTQGIKSGNVICELQDREGNHWFSIAGEGIYRYDGTSFTNFTTKDGLCDNYAGKMIQDKNGNILIGTRKGICKYDGKRFSTFIADNPVNVSAVCSLAEDKEGKIWFGTMGSGVYCYDGKKLVNYLNNHVFNLGAKHQLIQDILLDKDGNLWFCSWNGGGVWRYDGKTFTNFLPSRSYYLLNEDGRGGKPREQSQWPGFAPINSYTTSGDSLPDDMIFSISEDKAGNLWFATRRHGACRYDGKSFTSFGETQGFVSYGILDIKEDRHGNMWFSTDRNGVYCYDGKTFRNYTTKDGLVHNSVFSILEDKAGNLWFGTRWFGLSRFDGKTFTTFSEYKEE